MNFAIHLTHHLRIKGFAMQLINDNLIDMKTESICNILEKIMCERPGRLDVLKLQRYCLSLKPTDNDRKPSVSLKFVKNESIGPISMGLVESPRMST